MGVFARPPVIFVGTPSLEDVLLRSNRIFADVVIMSDALRLAIHLPRKAEHKLFMKVAQDRKHVTHVAKLRAMEELESMKPFLRKAYEHSIS